MKLTYIALALSILSSNIVLAEEFETYQGSSVENTKPKIKKVTKHHQVKQASSEKSNEDVEIVMTKAPDFQKIDKSSATKEETKTDKSEINVGSIDEELTKRPIASSKKVKHYKAKPTKEVKEQKEDKMDLVQLTDKNKKEIVAPRKNEYTVSNDVYALNEINIPFPVTKILYPSPVPIDMTKISYANDNKKVIFSFGSEGFNRVFPMKILGADQSVSIILRPIPVEGGSTINVSMDKPTITNLIKQTPSMMPRETATEADIKLMNQLMDNTVPEDYQEVAVPMVTKFDSFVAVPLMKKSNGSRNVLIFQLIATNGNITTLANKMFDKPGVLAVSLDRQVVEPNKITRLFIIERATDNE